MARALVVLLATSAACAATLTDDRIAEIAGRLRILMAKESARPRADTGQRAADLLRSVQPALAARLAPAQPAPASTIAQGNCSAPASLNQIERVSFVEDAFAFIRTLAIEQQYVPLTGLLNCFEPLQLDPKFIERVARQYLHVVEHAGESPAAYERLSILRRRYDLSVGSDNASVRARDALAELAALVNTDYDFSLRSLDGRSVTLKQHRGKVVMLAFWATWCAPCIREMPMFEQLYREHRTKGFELLAISDEEPEIVRAFLKEHGLTVPVLLDPAHTVFNQFRIPGMPSARILDRTGRLRAETGATGETELNQLLTVAGLE